MNLVSILVGVAAVAFGAYTAWARVRTPEHFKKLQPMKELWGERAGVIVHFAGYTLMPILLGLYIIYTGLRGGSFL